MKRSWLILLLFLVSRQLFAQMAKAQDIFHLSQPWLFYQSNEVSLNVSDIEKTDWRRQEAGAMFEQNPQHGVVGWYKTTFHWQDNGVEHAALFIKSLHHSDQVWLNGQLIGGLGEVHAPWDFFTVGPRNSPRLYSITKALQQGRNTLVIKLNIGFGNAWGALYPGGLGFNNAEIGIVEMALYQAALQQLSTSSVIKDTIILVLGLVDVFLILFLFRNAIHHFVEFKWLLSSSVLMLACIFGLDLPFVMQFSFRGQQHLMMLSLMALPMLSMMFFLSQHSFKYQRWFTYLGVVSLLLAGCLLLPATPIFIKSIAWTCWGTLAKLFYFIALVCAIKSVLNKQGGSVVQLIGLIVYMVSIRTQWLPFDFFEHRNIVYGTMFFRFSLLLAYFKRIQQMSVNYQRLSHHMLDVVEEQRKMIARELHDGLGQYLTTSKFQLQLAKSTGHNKHLELLKSELQNAIDVLQRLVAGLHPFNLDKFDLHYALQHEAQRLRNLYPLEITLHLDDKEVPKAMEIHLLRIFQESINNAYRHGKASKVAITLVVSKTKISLMIKDNGCGLTLDVKPSAGGFGLISMAERVHLMNGDVCFKNLSAGGCQTVVEIPLAKG